jgi:hypothetical protein
MSMPARGFVGDGDIPGIGAVVAVVAGDALRRGVAAAGVIPGIGAIGSPANAGAAGTQARRATSSRRLTSNKGPLDEMVAYYGP